MKNQLLSTFLVCATIISVAEQPNTYEIEIRDAFEFLSPDSFVRQKCLDSEDEICGPIGYMLFLQYRLGQLDRYFSKNEKEIEAYAEKIVI